MTAGQGAPSSSRHAGSRHARRARTYLVAGIASFVLIVVMLLFARPTQRAYMPGAEAATGDEITSVLKRGLPDDAPRIPFTDAAEEAGIRFRHFHGTRSTQLPEDMGSGAAWGDYDGDGDPDLFLVNESGPLTGASAATASSPARSALYRNDGGRFTDVT
ncbi:MAG TPA: hypothetical protein VFE84_07030, partial [Patescibacteria group bacterium]|nr:hypothetical protein [Patescibacteria group bacterium]